jgi:putative membrane protein
VPPKEIAMMYWGTGMGGWGMPLMTVSNVLFWALLIVGIVVLVHYLGRGTQPSGPPADAVTAAVTPQRILAERFARGEIDEEEYHRGLQVLTTAPPARHPGG